MDKKVLIMLNMLVIIVLMYKNQRNKKRERNPKKDVLTLMKYASLSDNLLSKDINYTPVDYTLEEAAEILKVSQDEIVTVYSKNEQAKLRHKAYDGVLVGYAFQGQVLYGVEKVNAFKTAYDGSTAYVEYKDIEKIMG